MGFKIDKILLIAPRGLYTKIRMGRERRVTPQTFSSTYPQGFFIIDTNKGKHILRIGDLPHIIKTKAIDKMLYMGLPAFLHFALYAFHPKAADFLEKVLKARKGDKDAIDYLGKLEYLGSKETSKIEPTLYINYQNLIPYYSSELTARRLPYLKVLANDLKNIGLNVISMEDFAEGQNLSKVCEKLAKREDLAFAIGLNFDPLDRSKGIISDAKIKIIKLSFPFGHITSWQGSSLWQTAHKSFVFYPNDLILSSSLEQIKEDPKKILALPEMSKML
jgi:hypothetical protein